MMSWRGITHPYYTRCPSRAQYYKEIHQITRRQFTPHLCRLQIYDDLNDSRNLPCLKCTTFTAQCVMWIANSVRKHTNTHLDNYTDIYISSQSPESHIYMSAHITRTYIAHTSCYSSYIFVHQVLCAPRAQVLRAIPMR